MDVSINKNGLCFVELRSGTLNFLWVTRDYMEWPLALSAISFELSVKGEVFRFRGKRFRSRWTITIEYPPLDLRSLSNIDCFKRRLFKKAY